MNAAEEHEYARHDCNAVHNCFAIICASSQIRIGIVAKFVDDGLTIIRDARSRELIESATMPPSPRLKALPE